MIANINPELINQEFLKEEIKSLEKGYVETLINLIKWPLFIKDCEDAILLADGERKEALEKTIKQHQSNEESNQSAVRQLNAIIKEAKKYLTK